MATHASKAGKRRGEAQPYDFRRPNKFGRDHMRALQIVNETWARQFGTVLATSLRTSTGVTLLSVDQLTYDEYIHELPNPSYMEILSLHPLSGAALLQLPPEVCFASVDRMLGGKGEQSSIQRALTEIENKLIHGITDRAMRELSASFENIFRFEHGYLRNEANPAFAAICAPSDMCAVITLEIKINDVRGKATLCIPYDTIQPILESITEQAEFNERGAGELAEFAGQLSDAVRDVPIDITVRMNPVVLESGEIVSLAVGDVIPFGHAVSKPLTVMVDGTPCFEAITGRRGKRLACLIVGNEKSEK